MIRLFSRSQASDTDPPPAAPSTSEGDPGQRPIQARSTDAGEIQLMGHTAVATLTTSELSLQNGVESLSNLLLDLAETGAHHYVLDTQNVEFMDSACLGCLVEAINRLAASGGRIAIANANRNVQYLFRMTRLDRVFMICNDVISAIEALDRQASA